MARPIDREENYEVTVNALTARATPATTKTWFNPGTVENVEIVIPAGVAGLAGLRISIAGTQIFPTNTGSWIVGDNEVILRDVYNWPNSGRLEVEAYNEDIHAHTFQVRYGISENPLPTPAPEQTREPLAVTQTGEAAPNPGEAPQVGGVGEESPVGAPPPVETPPLETPQSPPETTPTEPTPPTEAPPGAPELPPEAVTEPSAELPAETEPPLSFPEETFGAPAGEAEAEDEGATGEPGGVKAPGGPKLKRTPPAKTKTKTVTTKTSHPAGGWLPHGARFTLERQDQGQDFITDWRGPIVAPASGTVLHNLSDKPFPAGFGPSYCVVHIDSGPFGGKDWYIGHCTSAVKAGQKFKAGQVLAHADQGHVSGGGWCELGYAPSGYPGPMSDGAKFAGLFRTVVTTTTKKVKVAPPKRTKPKTGKAAPKKKGAPKKRTKPKGKAKAKTAPAKRKPAAKAPRVKTVKAKRTPRVKPAKAAKAPRVKRVKAVKAPRPKRVKAAAPAKAPAKKRKR